MKKSLALLLILSTVSSVQASEYGCQVLLCLANPASNGGPKGVAECVQPIDQLYRDLRKGRPFPSCDLADGNDGSSHARVVFDPYDPCPAALQPAVPGSHVVQGQRRVVRSRPQELADVSRYTVKGQPQVSEPLHRDAETMGPRACVGKLIGAFSLGSHEDGYTVSVFDQVTWLLPQSPHGIDVFTDHVWRLRVRW
ncbi:hypothetical protein [Acidovorax sp. CCYZU-2555]|jgi:hypothetical protein|uniref:hypothetical protein n=1 Tax=Acidovorax sp. CCYZU-2555 TaxID=2835042 RepID=UPI001BD18328|nr:hypothetical protein [Acidovorax sp. CCYZU-2555]MBS7776856.1 hypothetical protein [Acidovorax sp. CCYZU-2555]